MSLVRIAGQHAAWTIVAFQLAGCMAAAPPPPPATPAYQPTFSFKAPDSGKKVDVTVGVVSPQYTTGAAMYRDHYKDDDVVKAMLGSIQSSFNEILVAKGFNTKGPFDSRETMTFPDKKGSDLLLYPEFNFQIDVKTDNQRAAPSADNGGTGKTFTLGNLLSGSSTSPAAPGGAAKPGQPTQMACDVILSVIGDVSFVAQEPLSGEVMWRKKIDISKAKETIANQAGSVCGSGAWTQDVKNAWAHAHEAIFQSSMKALNDYVNGDEFAEFKRQAKEIRDKKAY